MEDNRDKLIPAQLAGYTWELSGKEIYPTFPSSCTTLKSS